MTISWGERVNLVNSAFSSEAQYSINVGRKEVKKDNMSTEQ